MKLLLVLLAVLAGVWLWRSGRRNPPPQQRRGKPSGSAVQDMVRCETCGVHLPRADAVEGRRGCYCSAAHRAQAED